MIRNDFFAAALNTGFLRMYFGIELPRNKISFPIKNIALLVFAAKTTESKMSGLLR
jgi:hypothetical protein